MLPKSIIAVLVWQECHAQKERRMPELRDLQLTDHGSRIATVLKTQRFLNRNSLKIATVSVDYGVLRC